MMRLIAAMAFLLITLPDLYSQQTWGMLRFGMSVNEAKTALAKRGLELKPGADDDNFTISPDLAIKLPGNKLAWLLRPDLRFDGGFLRLVTLTVDKDKMLEQDPSQSAAIFASELDHNLYPQLLGKYGVPLTHIGVCDALTEQMLRVGPDDPSCIARWKSTGQIITFHWVYKRSANDLAATIEYTPLIDEF